MTTNQNLIKHFAIGLAILIITSILSVIGMLLNILIGFSTNSNNQTKLKDLDYLNVEKKEISKLDISLKTSNLEIKIGKEFNVSSNNDNISSSITNNRLVIKEDKNDWFKRSKYKLIVTIPKNHEFSSVLINSGAGNISIEEISSKKAKFDLGAGKVKINNLLISEQADIDGGVGEVDILNGSLHNLTFDLGVGQSDLNFSLSGRSFIDLGIGEVNINIVDSIDNYKTNIEKGIGRITVDGASVKNNHEFGSGPNYIGIKGGIGSFNLNFV